MTKRSLAHRAGKIKIERGERDRDRGSDCKTDN